MEAYLTPNTSRFERKRVRWNNGGDDDVSGRGAYTHMTLLAETTEGMHNLFRLSSRSSHRGLLLQAAHRPRAARRARQGPDRHHRLPVRRGPDLAADRRLRQGPRRRPADFQDIFGRDNFFLELMDHGLSTSRPGSATGCCGCAKDLGIPPIATNDSHYTNAGDAPAHEHLLCVSSGSTMADPKRFKFDGDGYYIKSPAEMRELWASATACPRPATTRC